MDKVRQQYVASVSLEWPGNEPAFEVRAPSWAVVRDALRVALQELRRAGTSDDGRVLTDIESGGSIAAFNYLRGFEKGKGELYFASGGLRISLIRSSVTPDATNEFNLGAGLPPVIYNNDGKRITGRWVRAHAKNEDSYRAAVATHAGLALTGSVIPSAYELAYRVFVNGESHLLAPQPPSGRTGAKPCGHHRSQRTNRRR